MRKYHQRLTKLIKHSKYEYNSREKLAIFKKKKALKTKLNTDEEKQIN